MDALRLSSLFLSHSYLSGVNSLWIYSSHLTSISVFSLPGVSPLGDGGVKSSIITAKKYHHEWLLYHQLASTHFQSQTWIEWATLGRLVTLMASWLVSNKVSLEGSLSNRWRSKGIVGDVVFGTHERSEKRNSQLLLGNYTHILCTFVLYMTLTKRNVHFFKSLQKRQKRYILNNRSDDMPDWPIIFFSFL